MADPKRVDSGGGIGAVADLLKLFGGTQQSTQSNANTGPLQGVLGQLQGVDPNALLQTILQQTLGQAPALQARFSNAVGSRSGNNGASQAAMSQLMSDTALKGQAQMMQQQQQNLATQAQVANSIAQASQGTKTTAGTNLGKAATGLGALQAIGGVAGSDFFKKGKDALGGFFSDSSGAAPSLSSAFSSNFGSPVGGAAGGDWLSSFNGGLNASSGASGMGISSALGSLGDYFGSSGSFDAGEVGSAGSASGGFGDSLGGVWDSVTDFFGFVDGGLVGRDGEKMKKGKQDGKKEGKNEGKSTQSYADGGSVNVRSGGGRRSSAPTYSPDAILASLANQGGMQGLQGLQQQLMGGGRPQENAIRGDAQGSDASGYESMFGVGAFAPGLQAQNNAVASNFSQAMLGMMGVPGMASLPGTVASMLGAGMAQSNAQSAVNEAEDPLGAFLAATQTVSPAAASQMGANTLGHAANANAAMNNVDPMTALMAITNAFGTGAPGVSGAAPGELGNNVDPASGFFGSDAGAAGGYGDDGGLGATAGSGNSGGDDGAGESSDGEGAASGAGDYAHGGDVQGPGTGTSDSINAKLSDGEYIMSADVVKALGVDFFDQLQKEFHHAKQ